MAVKRRTIFEFGKVGEVPTFCHHIEGTSIIFREIESTSLKVGDYAPIDGDDTVFTGREFQLKFQTTQSVISFIDRLPYIVNQLWCKENGKKPKNHGAMVKIDIMGKK